MPAGTPKTESDEKSSTDTQTATTAWPHPSWYSYQPATADAGPYITLPPLPATPTSPATPVFLTKLYSNDASPLQRIMSKPSVGSALLNAPRPYGIADATSWIALQTSPSAPCLPMLGIRLHFPNEAGLFVGSVAVTNRATSGEKPIYELGYSLHPEYWGMGIMKNAVVAVMTWATEEVGVEEVYVRIQEVNERSKGVLNGVPQFKREEDQPINWRGFQTVTGIWRWKASNTNV